MFGLLCATAFAAWVLWFVFDAVRGLRRNLEAARQSGLEWIVARGFFFFLGFEISFAIGGKGINGLH